MHSYLCYCNEGYKLKEDGLNCIGKTIMPVMYDIMLIPFQILMNVLLETMDVNKNVSMLMDHSPVNVRMALLWTVMAKHVLSAVEVNFQMLVDPSRLLGGLMDIPKKISSVNG